MRGSCFFAQRDIFLAQSRIERRGSQRQSFLAQSRRERRGSKSNGFLSILCESESQNLKIYSLRNSAFSASLRESLSKLCLLIILFCPLQIHAQRDAQKIGSLLMEASKLSKGENIPLFFARKFIGIPYVAHTLEVNDDERLVVNTRQLDCTTFVETVTALTLCVYNKEYSYDAYLRHLQNMRYREGRIEDYTSRIHYFTEWIVENQRAGIVKEIQAPNPPFTAIQTVKVNYMSRHPQSYKALKAHPEYVPAISKMEKSLTGKKFRYIPKAQIGDSKAMREAVHDGDIIAITCNKPGLDIAHLGFAVWHKDGLHLLNASQIHKKVIDEPMTLREYLKKHPSHTGIRIVRIK